MEDAVRLQCSDTPAAVERGHVLYKVENRLPFVFSFLNALQILLCNVLHILWLPILLSPALCLLPADPAKVVLVSTAFLTSGVVTTLQSFLGVSAEIARVFENTCAQAIDKRSWGTALMVRLHKGHASHGTLLGMRNSARLTRGYSQGGFLSLHYCGIWLMITSEQ
ncbi:hypothetical protein J6590_022307 [Homalodisca vitripennis]|nr:hypothetical protein J6590_022307 [Homalodisca vitripennis]